MSTRYNLFQSRFIRDFEPTSGTSASLKERFVMRFYRCLLLLNALALRVCLVAIGVWAFADGVGFAQNTDENGPIMTLSRTGEPIGDVSRARTERLERYEVDPENRNLRSVDGVVYSKDMKKLLAVPKKYPVKDFIIPSGVEKIEEGAFSGCLLVESVSTPESLKEIGDLAFGNVVRYVRSFFPRESFLLEAPRLKRVAR